MFLEDKMKNRMVAGAAFLFLFGSTLGAQDVRYGFAFNLAAPTGAFNTTTYPSNTQNPAPTQDAYNSGVGLDFMVCVPMNPYVAMRFNVGLETFTGTATSSGYYPLNLQDQMFSLGAAAQFFLADGNANRQSGTYILAGGSLDLERFDTSYGDPSYSPDSTLSKTRLAAVVGVGHTFRSRWGMRYLIEGSFHKTLTGENTAAGNPPAADFLKFNFGFIF